MRFRLFFTDLMVFVPNSDEGKQETTVLLVEGREPEPSHAEPNETLGPHEPFLLCDARSVANLSAPVPEAEYSSIRFSLDDEQIGLSVQNSASINPPSLVEQGNGATPAELTGENADHFSWLARLEDFSKPGDEQILDGCFQQNPPAGTISARVKLRQGRLKTFRIGDRAGQIFPFLFQFSDQAGISAPPTFRQHAGDIFVLEMELDEGAHVVIERTPLRGSQPHPPIILKASDLNDGSRGIDAIIANSPNNLMPDATSRLVAEVDESGSITPTAAGTPSISSFLGRPKGVLETICPEEEESLRSLDLELLYKVSRNGKNARRAFAAYDIAAPTAATVQSPRLPEVIRQLAGDGSILACSACLCARGAPHPDA